jgi:DNA-binding response OmpR family regulator
MARILLIDDDPALLDALALAFEDAGHQVECYGDGLVGHSAIQVRQPDLVVSDVNMPSLDGFSLCRRVREAGNAVPIILLTARDGEIDEALGLELGADDYVVKPFSTRVLLARVKALLRRQAARTKGEKSAQPLEVGQLLMDPERLEVRYQGKLLQTTVTEFRLLETLARRPGVVFSRSRLLDLIRDDDSVVADRIIDTYVRRIRRKLEDIDPLFRGVETVIGAGYRWRG